MKKLMIILIACCLLLPAAGWSQDDVKAFHSCKYCGMDRAKFAHSRMLLNFTDGSSVGTCSIHCLAVDLALNIDKTPNMIQVGDYKSKKLIDAEKAYWVLGGSVTGVMTRRAKWAFEAKEDADAFVAEKGGKLVNFDGAIKASYEDMNDDTRMIRERRKMKMKMKMEQKQ